MNRSEKRLLRRTLQLGLLLTLLVIVADFAGTLDPLEGYLHDFRARHFQYFTPRPTDQIVLLDIDDPSLTAIGSFPWRRTKLAEMVDEIKLAGAKVIGLDIIFPEVQDLRIEQDPDGSYVKIDDDANFGDAIARSGNVLVPVTVTLDERSRPPLIDAMVGLLRSNLELDVAGISAKLRGTKFDTPEMPQQVRMWFFEAQDRAAFDRVSALLDSGETDFEKIYASVAPAAAAANERGDLRQLLLKTIPKARSVKKLLADFSVPIPRDMPPLLGASSEQATIPQLLGAAKFSGAVDWVREKDGVVRSIPLFINYRGRLMPHMALAASCAALGVRLQDLQLTADSITIPVHDGPPIVVPVRSIKSETFGKVGMFLEVPWFGNYGPGSWLTMFDAPAHAESRQHVPLSVVWDIRQSVADIDTNNRAADEALFALNAAYHSPARDAYLATPVKQRTDAQRSSVVAATITEMNELGAMVENAKPVDLNQDDQKFLASWRALGHAAKSNQNLGSRVEKRRKDLHALLDGRYALIGWTAAGTTDFYPTSLHPLCPGDAIQATVFNGIVTRHLWTVSSPWIGALMTLILGSLTTLAVATLSTRPALAFTLLLTCCYLLINGLLFFDYGNHIVGAAGPLTAAALIWFGLTVARYIYEQAERSRITARFSSYVDPALVNFVVENPEAARFDGQVKEMTVCFTDLAGFTTISEKLRERTVPMLNEYMSLMLPIIRENRGYWNKFLGDGIMFFFNAPADNDRHARDAVVTVLQMQKAMEEFNQRLFKRGLPQVAMRAGVATGTMVVGDAGSTDAKHHASDYTVLGDEVNLGARLESANKAFGSRVMLSDRTSQLIGNDVLLRPLAKLVVVGKTQGIMAHEALCLQNEATDRHKLLADISTQIVTHFVSSQFDACIKAAQQLEERCGSTKFTQLYLRLAREYLIAPPGEGFDGTITLSDK
jgi:class 3 adenylate cyclase/CHASE2 domain-containing sensor protein